MTGYEKVLPDVDVIESVYFYGSEPSHDRELIEKTHKLHEAILENKASIEKSSESPYVYNSYATLSRDIGIGYQLKNGRKIERYYMVRDQDRTSIVTECWYDLITTPEYIIAYHFGENFDPGVIQRIDLVSTDAVGSYTGEDAVKLYHALLKDIRENNVLDDYIRYGSYEFFNKLDLEMTIRTEDDMIPISLKGFSKEADNMISVLRELDYEVDKALGIYEEEGKCEAFF